MAKNAEHNRIQNELNAVLKLVNTAEEHDSLLSNLLELADREYLTIDEVRHHVRFMPDSIVIIPEKEPKELCFYSPNGVNLIPIINMEVQEHPHKEFLQRDDVNEYGFHDAGTFIHFFKGYPNDIVCIKATTKQNVHRDEPKLLEY